MPPTPAPPLKQQRISLLQSPLLPLLVAIYMGSGDPAPARSGHDASNAFHGAVSIPLTRQTWLWGSVPVGQSGLVFDHAIVEWYNARGVQERDLNPALTWEVGGDDERQVLELNVKPPTGETALSTEDWTAISQGFSTVGQDLTKAQFVEIWINDFTPDHAATQGTLQINFGRFSEDAFWDPRNPPNGRLESEDKNGDGRLDGGDNYLFAEDTGLDGLFDEQEPGYEPSTNPDPNDDDYAYTYGTDNYSRINNFERNGNDDPNARPDTEDLNRNGAFDTENNYFEASIDLSDTEFVAIDVPRLYAGDPDVKADNGWRLFRIPISEATFTQIGFATWDNVQAVRVWVADTTEPIRIQIGGISLRGEGLPVPVSKTILYQNYPNPFNPSTTIPYLLAADGPVRLTVFDVNGRTVHRRVFALQSAGIHYAIWNGRDNSGRPVGSGIYFYQLEAGGKQLTRRMVLVK